MKDIFVALGIFLLAILPLVLWAGFWVWFIIQVLDILRSAVA